MLSCFMVAVLLLPMSLNAQSNKSDDFFKTDDSFGGINLRSDLGIATGITTYGIGEEVPVGGGLLILLGAGAGYAVARRKRTAKTRKGATLVMALALLLGMTQCKKNVEQIVPNAGGVINGTRITLNVGDGAKVIVDPTNNGANNYASVRFEDGDKIYVANNGTLCGIIEYDEANEVFTGNIDESVAYRSESDYLHFYFMGNKAPNTTITVNSTYSFYVDITDQTEKYPVISYAHSTSLYVPGKTDYTAKLQIYCAITKFTTNIPTDNVVTIKGMNNKVTVKFNGATLPSYQPYTYGMMDTEGRIQLHPEGTAGTEKWAILLPQNEVNATAIVKNYATESSFTVPEVIADPEHAYMNDGININLVRVFTVGHVTDGYTKAIFAPGNLQYRANPSTWRFAEHQWDYVGGVEEVYQSGTHVYPQYGNVFEGGVQCNNNEISTSYNGWIDLFGWGTGDNPTNTSTSNNAYGVFNDWGNNAISYGSTTYASGYWQTPNQDDYNYLINTRKLSNVTVSGGAKAEVYGWGVATITIASDNEVKGLIFFPDDWDGTANTTFNYPTKSGSTWTSNYAFTANQLSAEVWNNMESKGCVLIPSSGKRMNGYAPYYYAYDNGFLYCWNKKLALYCAGGVNGPQANNGLNVAVGACVRLYRIVAENESE